MENEAVEAEGVATWRESGEKTWKMEELVRGRRERERERERQRSKSNADQSVRIRVVRQREKAAEEAGGAKVVFEASRRMAGVWQKVETEGGNHHRQSGEAMLRKHGTSP